MHNEATIIALAWPDTKVVKEGKWYDVPMQWIGVIKNDRYNAGHAALLLVNHANGDIHYFDYGRYHTPLKHGRVRDQHTDPDVTVKHKARMENGFISNLEEVLLERYHNKACHGEGRLTAAIVRDIDFEKAYHKAKQMQGREAIPYGPFMPNGSTCSRLVTQIVRVSTRNKLTKLLIKLPYTVSHTPRSNNKVLNDCSHYFEIMDGEVYLKKSKLFFLKYVLTSKTYKLAIPEGKLISKSV